MLHHFDAWVLSDAVIQQRFKALKACWESQSMFQPLAIILSHSGASKFLARKKKCIMSIMCMIDVFIDKGLFL